MKVCVLRNGSLFSFVVWLMSSSFRLLGGWLLCKSYLFMFGVLAFSLSLLQSGKWWLFFIGFLWPPSRQSWQPTSEGALAACFRSSGMVVRTAYPPVCLFCLPYWKAGLAATLRLSWLVATLNTIFKLWHWWDIDRIKPFQTDSFFNQLLANILWNSMFKDWLYKYMCCVHTH